MAKCLTNNLPIWSHWLESKIKCDIAHPSFSAGGGRRLPFKFSMFLEAKNIVGGFLVFKGDFLVPLLLDQQRVSNIFT